VFKQGDIILSGRYRIEDLAGEKKSCIVFKATRVSDGLPVSVKVLAPFVRRQPHVVSRLRSRAEFAMGMDHPNLFPVYEVRDEGESFMIVEGWLEALPLLRVVRGKGACSPYETAWLASQLSKGVDHLISSGAPGFDFTLSDVYADIGDLRKEMEFYSMPVHRWPDLGVRLSPLALEGEGFSERSLATPTDSAQPLIRSVARIIFNLVTGGMGDPLVEPVLSEKFTASLRDCLTGALQTGTCRELLWTLFGDFGPEVTAVLPQAGEAKDAADGEVGSILDDLDRQGEELEALLRYKAFGKQIKRQLAVLEEQRAGVMEQQRRLRDDGERLQTLEDRLQAERNQLAGQRDELARRGSELEEKVQAADEVAQARAAELREREVELEALHAEQERERSQVRAELERLRVNQEGLAREKEDLSERVALYSKEQQELAASRESLEAGRRKLDAEREEIEGRVGEFKRLKSEIELSERELEEKRQALSRRQTEIETKGVGLSSSERELSDRLAAEQKELEAKIEGLQAKNRSLDEREEALRAKESALTSANHALVREEETLAGRMGEVDEKLALERSRLTDKEREIRSREDSLAAKEAELQAKLERQRSVQDEKEILVEELRGKLAGVTGELEAVTTEKQRLEAEQSKLRESQDALGERSDSIGRERLDLKAFEEKLRRELHEESETRSRDNRALERRIVRYRMLLRVGVPVAAVVIVALGALLLAKPKFPDAATAVRGMPEWKQEWLRKDLAADIGKRVGAGEWRNALGSLHYYALGFSRRPDEVMDAAKRTCGALAKEFDAAPQSFAAVYRDKEGQESPITPALEEMAGWGIADAERVALQLKAREALRQAQEEHSLGARAAALRAIVELKRFYPDVPSWLLAVSPVLRPLVATSIGEAVTLLDPGNSSRELSKGFSEVFSDEQVVRDLKELEAAGLKEAAALRVAAEGLGKLTQADAADPGVLAIFISDRLAEDWPVEIRVKLISVLVAHIDHFRNQLKDGKNGFVDALEDDREKPGEVVRVAEALWRHMDKDYQPDWFGKDQLRDLYLFIGDALTAHQGKRVNVHPAYQFAANNGSEEGMYWSGRGLVGAALRERGGDGEGEGEGPEMEVANEKAYEDGRFLLEEAAKSSTPRIRQEALWVLSEAALGLGDSEAALKGARRAYEAGKSLKAASAYFDALTAEYSRAPDPALADELGALAVEAAKMTRDAPGDPQAEEVLGLALNALAALVQSGISPPVEVMEELELQFKIDSAKESFAGLRFGMRAKWKSLRLPPYAEIEEEVRVRQFLEDLWESARAGYAPARKAAEDNGLKWQMDKEAAMREAMGE